jgi:cobalt-zinc-cadmium efflux system membrane fusion protein
LAPDLVTKAGIEMLKAGPADIRESLSLRGLVRLNAEQMVYVTPRFPGIVRKVFKGLGDVVKKGDVLATIESNESLQTYEVKAEIDGTIIAKDATLGETVDSQKSLFTVADLSTVWVDFTVHRNDFDLLKAGQPVDIEIGGGREPVRAQIDYLSPLGAEASQTMLARSIVPNPAGLLRPGVFVVGTVTTESARVPVAVKASALQTFRDWDVVFIRVGDTFEAVPIEMGRRDDQWVEVTEGLPEGSEYAAENSFIIKADVMKSGATHDH